MPTPSVAVAAAAGAAESTVNQGSQAGTVAGQRAGGSIVPLTNPSMRFDVDAGVVVIEFFNDRGEVARTIPSDRVIEAYAQGNAGPSPTALVLDEAG
ncbi:MAG: hypothetical protein SNJ73_08090 [Acetobacteraceae bacterium]